MSQISTIDVPRSHARLGANHGYVIDGDVAQLHADVELLEHPPLAGDWVLQLWACDAPHAGGPLTGVKVAEAALTGVLDGGDQGWHLDAAAQARVPGGQRDYAMVLVLASGEGDHDPQVHDFANYPARQRFVTPHFNGSVGYEIDETLVVLKADAIHNPRDADNISGSLRLELWALAEPYRGGMLEGHVLGLADLSRLPGQTSLHAISERVPFSPPSAGSWHVTLVLREWAGATGYVTRDYAQCAVRCVVADPPPVAHVVAEHVPTAKEGSRANRVSINSASAEELAAVKGLSRKVAKEIVKGRPYASIDALLEVKGIGPKLLGTLRASLTLG